MNKELFIRRKMTELEEFGDAHGHGCQVNMEYPDECDCAEFKAIRRVLEENIGRGAQAAGLRPIMPPKGTQEWRVLQRLLDAEGS